MTKIHQQQFWEREEIRNWGGGTRKKFKISLFFFSNFVHLKNSGGIGQPRNSISPNSINKKSIRKKKKKTKLASKFPSLNQLALFTLVCLFVRRQRRNADNSVVVVLVCFILSIGQQHHTHTFCCIAFRFFPFDLKVERPRQKLKI